MDFYRLIDTIDINQINSNDLYRFIDWNIGIDFYRLATPGNTAASPRSDRLPRLERGEAAVNSQATLCIRPAPLKFELTNQR